MFMVFAAAIGVIVGLTIDAAAGFFSGLLLIGAAYAARSIVRED